MLRGFREDLADLDAALAIRPKLKWGRQRASGGSFGGEIPSRNDFLRPLCQRRFWVESVHVRRPAIQINVDDALGACGKLRLLRRQRVTNGGCACGHEQPGILQQGGETQHAEAGAHLAQQLAARQQLGRQMFERIHGLEMGVHSFTASVNKYGFIRD